ncbi:MAG: hypothetical protein MPI95_04785 [Nitrosopumilus sp.]|nr:hypothetical protein [Nitrosopumilus sp.]CAI9832628.1 hypothetical protein IBTHAUMO2_890016 [Nitrosopumilaceae archaeon]MDA7942198.1 hypothetical protein [Nitrosopumilus sp.]MDA7943513.1 hypothetical protein [Nitrosopumilus sp.]MDA7944942.1 hypothetical protein [Nitrosopumilus sp.]
MGDDEPSAWDLAAPVVLAGSILYGIHLYRSHKRRKEAERRRRERREFLKPPGGRKTPV